MSVEAPPERPLRIVAHDYAGHAFPAHLSRWLADRGHKVLHLYCGSVEAPRGRLSRQPADPQSLSIEAVSLARPIAKYDFLRRWLAERRYGGLVARRIAAFRPDATLCANTPPAALARLAGASARRGQPLVVWVQDLFSPGVRRVVRDWPAPARAFACRVVERAEIGAMRSAAALVTISPDFAPLIAGYGLRHPACTMIENWAPLGEIAPRPKDNPWARRHGLADRFVFLSSGTLGMKHNPMLLAELARAFRDDDGVRVAVVSQGLGRACLEDVKARESLDNLLLFDYQPYDALSDVLATGDVAVTLLESFAGALSVPSKVYSYFCAERAILAAIGQDNLARRLIEREQAGLCVDPDDVAGFIAAARRLRVDPALRAACGRRQAAYAAETFDIQRIGPRFEAVLRDAAARGGRSASAVKAGPTGGADGGD